MRTALLVLLIGVVVSLRPWPSLAGMLDVSPTVIEMVGGTRASTLHIANRDAAPVTVQVRVYAWDQPEGTDRYQPTAEVQVSPPIFSLPAGESQVVRIVAPGSPPSEERPFRLIIDQVPEIATSALSIQVPIRIELPVFLTPSPGLAPALEWRAELIGPELLISATNTGGRRARLVDLSVTGGSGRNFGRLSGLSGYVLTGATRIWKFPVSSAAGTVRITASGDSGPIAEEAHISVR